jgi:hypothetical protein
MQRVNRPRPLDKKEGIVSPGDNRRDVVTPGLALGVVDNADRSMRTRFVEPRDAEALRAGMEAE